MTQKKATMSLKEILTSLRTPNTSTAQLSPAVNASYNKTSSDLTLTSVQLSKAGSTWNFSEANNQPFHERGVDVLATGKESASTKEQNKAQLEAEALEDFIRSLPSTDQTSQKSPLLKLPDVARRCIMEFLFSTPKNRKVTLSPQFATKDVFPDDYFATPFEILNGLESVIFTCRRLRDDAMTYFWTSYEFHMTISPLTGPATSPLSQQWLKLYADRIQHLTLEVDLTKFGLGAGKSAALLKPLNNKIKKCAGDHFADLKNREGKMAYLHLLVRRFKGMRPDGHAKPDDQSRRKEAVPYCPDEYLSTCENIETLQGLVRKVRLSGVSEEFAQRAMTALFDGAPIPQALDPEDKAWPDWFLLQPGANRTYSNGPLSIRSSIKSGTSSWSTCSSQSIDGPATPANPSGLGFNTDFNQSRSFTGEVGNALSRTTPSAESVLTARDTSLHQLAQVVSAQTIGSQDGATEQHHTTSEAESSSKTKGPSKKSKARAKKAKAKAEAQIGAPSNPK